MALPNRHPGPRRALHMANMWLMLFLIVSGLIMHWGPSGVNVETLRFLHISAGTVLAAVVVARVYYAFAGRWADWREFTLGKEQWRLLPGVLRYYFLFQGPGPSKEMHNPLQRLTYLLVLALVVAQGWFGLMLTWPDTLAPGTSLLLVRGLHYALSWLVISYVMLHFYVVLIEAREYVLPMTLGVGGRSTFEPEVVRSAEGSGAWYR